jgi:hypothetical protein
MQNDSLPCLDIFPVNERNGIYGGKAGNKEGITIDGEYWLVKYPQSTRGMRGELDSYTTSPLSEYIGSNIYRILGIDVHRTMLGVRNGKVVVACRDFCRNEGSLREIRTLKNIYNNELSKKLEESFSSTSSSHLVDIDEMMIQLQYNPILQNVAGIKERFWEQVITDVLINNNDRNNGNWGVLYENGCYSLAPVFDNGAAFSNKLPDVKLQDIIKDEARLIQSLDTSKTVYQKDGKQLYAKDIVNIGYEGLYKAALRLVPVIKDNTDEISAFIMSIPEKTGDMEVCSGIRKEFYIRTTLMRLERYLMPLMNKAENYRE